MWHILHYAHTPFSQLKPSATFFYHRHIFAKPQIFTWVKIFCSIFSITCTNNCFLDGFFGGWQTTALGQHRSDKTEAIKCQRHKKIRATDSVSPGHINHFFWRNRRLTSLNVNNIRQPDLVPSGPDKAPHPMRVPGQIWR